MDGEKVNGTFLHRQIDEQAQCCAVAALISYLSNANCIGQLLG